MSSLSDRSHVETCAGKNCRAMDTRAAMHRIPGKRGWFCDRCHAFVMRLAARVDDLERPDLLSRLKTQIRTK